MTFRKDCRFLGGLIDLEKNQRVCALTSNTIASCDGCNTFMSVHTACEVCNIFKVCQRKSVPPPPLIDSNQVVMTPYNKPFAQPPKRNMLWHLWPNEQGSNGVWQWNVQHLLAYIEQFDGVRSIAVAVDGQTASIETVQAMFADTRIDNWIVVPNHAQQRETVTFVPLMNTLPRDDSITWYGHAKGVRHINPEIPQIWAHVMYRLLLEHIDDIVKCLERFPVAGAFKRLNEFHIPKHYVWHYSGTFYWFRNSEVFSRDGWDDISKFFAGTEAWPSRIFKREEAWCIFDSSETNLYAKREWVQMQPALERRGIFLNLWE